MTKTRTLRASSKYLSKRYKFIRALKTNPCVKDSFRDRDERINRVHPIKDIHVYEPAHFEPIVPGTEPVPISIERPPRVLITRYSTNWPFRVEFAEQLLELNELWVVLARSGARPDRGYSTHSVRQTTLKDLTLDLIRIEKPQIIRGEVPPYGTGRRPLYTEKELFGLEEEFLKTAFTTAAEPLYLQGRHRIDQCVDLYLCNILPHNLAMYNCTFYNREVANLYMESLSEHITRFVQGELDQ